MSATKAGPIVGLEVMRALAALLVLANHLVARTEGLASHRFFNFLTNFATEAVIAFFVLSGVVITLKTRDDVGRYLFDRCVRIMPIFYVALGLALVVDLVVSGSVVVKSYVGTAFFTQTLQGYIVRPPWTNPPLWSLSFEMFFYFVFPVFFMFKSTLVRVLAIYALCIMLGVFMPAFEAPNWIMHFCLMFVYYTFWLNGALATRVAKSGVHVTRSTAIWAFALGTMLSRVPVTDEFYDFFRLFAFSLGSAVLCLYLVQDSFCDRKQSEMSRFCVPLSIKIGAIVFAAVLLVFVSSSALVTRFGLVALGVAALFWPLIEKLFVGKHLSAFAAPILRLLVYVGSISYALYAIHRPLIELLNAVPEIPSIIRIIIVVCLSFGLAHLLERVMQPRLSRWLKSRFYGQRVRAVH